MPDRIPGYGPHREQSHEDQGGVEEKRWSGESEGEHFDSLHQEDAVPHTASGRGGEGGEGEEGGEGGEGR